MTFLIILLLLWAAIDSAKRNPGRLKMLNRSKHSLTMAEYKAETARIKALQRERELQRKELERIEKREQQRELAQADLARTLAQRETLLYMLESIEKEIETPGTSDSRRLTLLSKKASTENRLYNLDRKADRLYSIAHQ